jgi:hypothetical protein
MVPYDSNKPISQWYHAGSFDTAAQCNTMLEWEMSTDYAKQVNARPKAIQDYQRALKDAQCIAGDDPRLAK